MLLRHHDMAPTDFERIAEFVKRFEPRIHPVILDDRINPGRTIRLISRPSIIFSPVQVKIFCPLRGRIFQGQWISKSAEYKALESFGIPIPRWKPLTPDYCPDLSGFDPYVVVKPDGGARGAEVKLIRRGRVKYKPWKTDLGVQTDDWIIQKFIYTGPYPSSYRVATLFGKALCAHKSELNLDCPQIPRPGHDGVISKFNGGEMINATRKGRCNINLSFDSEVIDFAERAHSAFPDIPLLGVDVVRDAVTGKLYVLEVNASGWVWHLSSSIGKNIQHDFNLNYESQFGWIEKAAHILVEQTTRYAS
ncbi:ATP-grasp domain-containing protein [Deltaproteobacteria bacterium]|nr:ATP-grasp domain-containing protein [Deltaproteobacteria bacterium]